MLETALGAFGISIDALPGDVRSVFDERQAFTLVRLDDVKDWKRRKCDEVARRIIDIPIELGVHPQAALTLETCSVHFIHDGRAASDLIATRGLESLPGFSTLDPIPVPNQLVDPETTELVPTGKGDSASKWLQLNTSKQSLRMEDTRPLNVIRVWNGRNVVANWRVADLHPRAESAFIFGRLSLPEFVNGDHLSGADRDGLADTPLVRAVRHWVAEQIEALVQRIHDANASEHTQEDRSHANDTLSKLRDLMRDFLESEQPGDEGQGTGGPGGNGNGPGRRRGSRVDEIAVESDAEGISVAVGTTVPVVVRGYEVQDDGRRLWVPGAEFAFHSSPEGRVTFGEGGITALAEGDGRIWFTHEGTGVRSSELVVSAVDCVGAKIEPAPTRLLLQGERLPLRIQLEPRPGGNRTDLLLDISIDELNMGSVTRLGVFTAGGREGTATVRLRYGPGNEDTTAIVLHIGRERVPRSEPRPRHHDGGGANADIPYILLCGTEVPGMEDRQRQFRTIEPSSHEPTIIDYEPEFEHVVFINPDSKESTQVRAKRGGRRGPMGIGTATFGQFLALKCFEILKRLMVFQENAGGALTPHKLREAFASAEQECAGFIEKAYELGREIAEEHERRSNGE